MVHVYYKSCVSFCANWFREVSEVVVPPCIVQLEAGVTLYIWSRNAGDLGSPCQCCVSRDVRGDVTSNGFHLTYQRRFVFSYGAVRTPELSDSTLFTGGPTMYYVMCSHSDEAL